MTRREAFALFSQNLAVVRWIGWALIALLIAAGFGFRTPRQQDAKQDSAIAELDATVSGIVTRQRKQDENFTIVFKLSCLNRQYSSRDFQLVGLKCDSLFGASPVYQAGSTRP